MGWGSGADFADAVWRAVSPYIRDSVMEKEAAQRLVALFEGEDCDTMFETEVGDVAGIVRDEEGCMRWEWETP